MEKLYQQDPFLTRFTAQVVSCAADKGGWSVVLDRTVFYPEGGGQPWDTGTLNGIPVTQVQEQDGAVVHTCAARLEPGTQVEGAVDWARRFDLMQQHSGEHIVSGILNRRYGCHNTGFHMGVDVITIDFDGVIPPQVLPEIEAEANGAVWQNLPVGCWYPSPEELPAIPYRSKKALAWPVRIVEIPGYDCCACCGTHVAATGEIGLIKLLSAVSFRGGTRIEMACGSQALALLNAAFDQNRQVSQAFSAKITETGEAAQRMNELLSAQKYRMAGLEKRVFAGIAESYGNRGNVLHFEEGLSADGVRELADAIADKCVGTAAVFSGSDGGYAYCLIARQGDLRQLGRDMTAALHGRGGGKPLCQQGRVQAAKGEIEAFFAGRK